VAPLEAEGVMHEGPSKRSYLHTGEFQWTSLELRSSTCNDERGRPIWDDNVKRILQLAQRVFVVRHFAFDPLGVGTHYEWHPVLVSGKEVRKSI
jgi:hypothetical protein